MTKKKAGGWSVATRAKFNAMLAAKRALAVKAKLKWANAPTAPDRKIGADDLDLVPLHALLTELANRGGTFKAVAQAQLLVLRKSADYNQAGGAGKDPATADRDQYFPFGAMSYAQMVHVKAQRLNSLVLKAADSGGTPNFEGIRDTLLDIINYSSFWIERLDREGGV